MSFNDFPPPSKQPCVGVNNEDARLARLAFLSKLGHEVPSYQKSDLNALEVKSNIESFLGSMSIPVGLVGPMLYQNSQALLGCYKE